MTKYVVNSGGVSHVPDKGAAFFKEAVKGLGENPKLLLCFFAKLRENWENKFQESTTNIKELLGEDIHPSFEIATPDEFEKQVKWADVIYIHGGDDHLVQYWLKQFDLPKLWEGKVIASNSAGSNALASSFWTCDWRTCMNGLGILPIKFLPHFKSSYGEDDPRGLVDWDKGLAELKEYGDKSLPIYALEEGKFEIFEM